jgi:hypothetical protein
MSEKNINWKQMSWKQLRWPLLAGIATAGIALSSYRATSPPSNCPDIGTVAGIVVGMLVATTIIHTWVTSVQVDLSQSGRLSNWCATSSGRHLLIIALGALMTAATLLLDIVLWAWVYRHVGAIDGLELSLYFSGITFTTVGYGDITLIHCWRLLSVGEAINGVLMAGWSTAQLIFIVQRAMTLQYHPEEGKSANQFPT